VTDRHQTECNTSSARYRCTLAALQRANQQQCTLTAGASRCAKTATCNCYFDDIWTLIVQIWKNSCSRNNRCTSVYKVAQTPTCFWLNF